MMTSRMMEKRKAQKASLSHSSLQSCRHSSRHHPHTGRAPPDAPVLTDRQEDILKVILDQMMKMTDAERCLQTCEDNRDTVISRCDGCGYR